MQRRKNIKKPFVMIVALALVIATGFAASFFAGCGDVQVIITMKDGEKTVDTILTDDKGIAAPDPEDYAKPGYEFTGFYNDAALTNKYAGTSFWRNSTLYLGYTSLEYTITFDLNGGVFAESGTNDDTTGSVEKPLRPNADAPVETPVLGKDGDYTLKVRSGQVLSVTAPTREHYDFSAWKCDGKAVDENDSFEYAADVTFVAQWRAHKSTVTYDPDGGKVFNNAGDLISSGIVRQYVDYDSRFEPYLAEKTGYSFLGWFGDGNKQLLASEQWQTEDNFSVKARYQANRYSITVTLSGGGAVTEKVTFDDEYNLSKYESVPSGYVFDSWEYALNGQSGTVPSNGIWRVAGNVTLVPRYTAKDYKLTLMLGSDRIYGTYNVAYNSDVTLPENPTAENKVFAGWFEHSDGSGERLLPYANWRWSGDKIFYARFLDAEEAVPFHVEYYLENADYASDELSVKYTESSGSYIAYGRIGETIKIDVANFGNKFENFGFDDEDALNGVTSATLTAESSVTLRFYFSRDTVKYTFLDGNDVVRYREYRIGQSVALSGFALKRGYELTGWKIGKSETVISADATDYSADRIDTVLYAVWNLKTYAVSIDGAHIFDIRYNEALTDEMKAALLLPDTADNTFDGLSAGEMYFSRADIAAMSVWAIDSDRKTADGTYQLNLVSKWQARKAYYTVEIWFEDEDGTFARSEAETFEKKADIGKRIDYDNNITQITVDGVVYIFDADHPDNVLETTVAADNSAVIRLHYRRAVSPSA